MKTKVIVVLVAILFVQNSVANETGGRRFWHGTGGAVVLSVGAYGLYRWLSDEETVDSPRLTFSKSTNQIVDSFYWNSEIYENEYDSIRLNYLMGKKSNLNVFTFIDLNAYRLAIDGNSLVPQNGNIYGVALNYDTNDMNIRIAFSQANNNNILERNSWNLTINHAF